jgi:hypothetical protein
VEGDFLPRETAAEKDAELLWRTFLDGRNQQYLPSNAVLESWTQQVPDEFQFVLKAPQKITHFKRLKNVSEDLEALLEAAGVLEQRRGPLLFQLPPNFKKDLPLLEAFLEHLDARSTAAFEFRHENWFDDEVYDCLHKKSCALCIADSEYCKLGLFAISTGSLHEEETGLLGRENPLPAMGHDLRLFQARGYRHWTDFRVAVPERDRIVT